MALRHVHEPPKPSKFLAYAGGKQKTLYTDLHIRRLIYNLVRKEGSLNAAAAVLRVSAPMLSMMLSGKRKIGKKVVARFGLERFDIYVRTGPGRRIAEVVELDEEMERDRVDEDPTAINTNSRRDDGVGGDGLGPNASPTTRSISGLDAQRGPARASLSPEVAWAAERVKGLLPETDPTEN